MTIQGGLNASLTVMQLLEYRAWRNDQCEKKTVVWDLTVQLIAM
jgi:hypothetical protein